MNRTVGNTLTVLSPQEDYVADTVNTQIILNGPRNIVLKRVNASDGTGETSAVVIDATSQTYAVQGVAPGVHLKVARIRYDVKGGQVSLQWDATAPVDMLDLGGFGTFDMKDFAGLTVPVVTGATGSILVTTKGFMPNSSYSLIFEMTKNVPQS